MSEVLGFRKLLEIIVINKISYILLATQHTLVKIRKKKEVNDRRDHSYSCTVVSKSDLMNGSLKKKKHLRVIEIDLDRMFTITEKKKCACE